MKKKESDVFYPDLPNTFFSVHHSTMNDFDVASHSCSRRKKNTLTTRSVGKRQKPFDDDDNNNDNNSLLKWKPEIQCWLAQEDAVGLGLFSALTEAYDAKA